MNSDAQTFESDYRFVFAKSGKSRAPRPGSSKPGGGSGGGPKPTTAATMRSKIMGAVSGKPQVMVKITSYGKSSQNVRDHVEYISRKGEIDVFDATGENLSEYSDRQGIERREALADVASELAAAQEAKRGEGTEKAGAKRRERVTMNLMLSMPAGTDTGAFELATRDFLSAQFGDRDHIFAFHNDKGHYHAHIVVGLQGQDGKWLNPRKADLQEWRERFAEGLERYGVPAQATPSYSRGNGKSGYRRDLHETRKRGTQRRPERSASYDADTEARAITKRAEAWGRIGDHYDKVGDAEAATAIKEYLREQFDYNPESPAPEKPQEAPAPVSAEAERVSKEFSEIAEKREDQQPGFRDSNDAWRFDTPAELRKTVDDYNQLPADQQPGALAKIAADPRTAALLKQARDERGRGSR
jgi:hypothetical protein